MAASGKWPQQAPADNFPTCIRIEFISVKFSKKAAPKVLAKLIVVVFKWLGEFRGSDYCFINWNDFFEIQEGNIVLSRKTILVIYLL